MHWSAPGAPLGPPRRGTDLTRDSNPPRVPLPRLIEKALDTSKCYTEECKKLGGEMRLCSPWVDGCLDSSTTDLSK